MSHIRCGYLRFESARLKKLKSLESLQESMAIYVSETAQIIGDVTVKKGSSIWHGTVLRADLDSIQVGEYTNIQDNAVLHLDLDFPTIVGDRVTVGHLAILHGCKVGNDCVIGMNSVLTNGAIIGDQSIVAPGAVISEREEFPERSVIAGIPGRVVKSVDERLKLRIDASWKIYHELAQKTLPAKKEFIGDRKKTVKVQSAEEISRVIKGK